MSETELARAYYEACRLVAVLSSCRVRGMEWTDSEEGKSNLLALQEVLADNMAARYFLEERYNLDKAEMSRRWSAKIRSIKL